MINAAQCLLTCDSLSTHGATDLRMPEPDQDDPLTQAAPPPLACTQVQQPEARLQEVALQLLALLGRCALPQGQAGGRDPGAALAAGEHPLAQACVLYVLRAGVIARLPDTAQVRLRKCHCMAWHTRAPCMLECAIGQAAGKGMGMLTDGKQAVLGCHNHHAWDIDSQLPSSSRAALQKQAGAAQRALLGKVAALLAEGKQGVPARLAALEVMRVLLGLLGEVPPEALPDLKHPVMLQLTCSHACLRHQVCSVLLTAGCA